MLKSEAKQIVIKAINDNQLFDSNSYTLSKVINEFNQQQIEEILELLHKDGVITLQKKYIHGISYSLNKD